MPNLIALKRVPKVLTLTKGKPLCHVFVRQYATKNTFSDKKGLPPAFSRAEAIGKYQTWANQLWFAPKEWKHQLGDKVVMHYLPHWYFYGTGTLRYVGRLGYNRTYQVVVNKRVEYRTTIDWRSVPERFIYDYDFSDETYASYEYERAHVTQIGPWELSQLGPLPSPPEHTVLDTYTIDHTTAYTLAWNEHIHGAAERVCLDDFQRSGYVADHYEIKTFSLHETALQYTMIYLPAYIMQYNYLGDDFHVIMNARTGRIRGYRQYDGDAISLALLGVSSAIYFGTLLFTAGTFTLGGAIGFVLVPPLLAGIAMRLQPQFMKRYFRPFMKERVNKFFTQHKVFPEIGQENEYEKIHTERERERERDYGRRERQRDYGRTGQQTSRQPPKIDLYKILGVNKNATQEEIKKAYRAKALETHPDHHPETRAEAEKKFKEVNQAYQVLSDSTAKREYDETGTFR